MRWRETISLILLFVVILLCLPGCSRSKSHCYLCEGLAYEAPCLVDLATGDVAELKPLDNEGHLTWTRYSGITVEHRPDGAVLATIPDSNQKIARELFCDNCLAAIDNTACEGYILADLEDLDSISLYTIEADQRFSLRQFDVLIVEQDTPNCLFVEVQG